MVTALIFLDLSVEFDTLDHKNITNLVSNWYCIDGVTDDLFLFRILIIVVLLKVIDERLPFHIVNNYFAL